MDIIKKLKSVSNKNDFDNKFINIIFRVYNDENDDNTIKDCKYVKISKKLSIIPRNAFRHSKIKAVLFPNNVSVICQYAFSYCKSLKYIKLPNSLTYINNCAFDYCINIDCLKIPDSVIYIGKCAFRDCVEIKSISIPNSVRYIGSSCFTTYDNVKFIQIPLKFSNDLFMIFYHVSEDRTRIIYT